MKHLKTFEDIKLDDYMYWTANPKNRFDVVMHKLNMCEENVEVFNLLLSDDKFDFRKRDKVCIVYNKYNNWFSWDEFSKKTLDWLDSQRYKYMGFLNVTPEDIEQYEIEKQIKNYNL
jgi:hypothetical protein